MKRGWWGNEKKTKTFINVGVWPLYEWVGFWNGWVGWLHFAQRSRDNKRRKFKAKLIF